MQVTCFRVFEPDGSQKLAHFNAFHYQEATGAMPCVRPGKWSEPYGLDRANALELINRWNFYSQHNGQRRVFVLAH